MNKVSQNLSDFITFISTGCSEQEALIEGMKRVNDEINRQYILALQVVLSLSVILSVFIAISFTATHAIA